MSSLQRIGIGTAQIGMIYGISNNLGMTTESDLRKILKDAEASGIQYIDTARLYGDAEETLGRCLPPEHPFRIVTKLPLILQGNQKYIEGSVKELFSDSLKKIRRSSLYGLLAHSAKDLLSPTGERIWNAFSELKQQGLVCKIGASIYRPEEAKVLLDRYPLELVQVPLNLLDQRMLQSGILQEMKNRGVEIHSRSCFLQGLLLMNPKTMAPFFFPIQDRILAIQKVCTEYNCTPLDLALSFALSVRAVDCIIIGVNSSAQFDEIRAAAALQKITEDKIDFGHFEFHDPQILEPVNWPQEGVKSDART